MAKLSVNQTLRRARLYAKNGEIKKAQALFESVVAAYPNNQDAKEALATLKKPAQIEVKKPPREKIDTLITLYNHRKFTQAYEQVEQLKQEYPTSFFLWNISGVVSKALGIIDKAEQGFRRAAEINPNFEPAYINLGIALKDQGKLDEAIASYQRALEIKPDHAETHYNIGIALQEQGKLDEAIASYQRALEIKPDYVVAYINMGNALKDQNKLDDAVAAYRQALKIKPDYAIAYNNIGNALKDQNKLDDAVAAYQRALQLKPDYAVAYINMGNALKDQSKLDDAIAAYQRALQLKPDYANACNNIGVVLQELGRLDEAIAAYRRALQLKPDYADAYNNLGVALQELGRLDEAIAAYRQALKIKPNYVRAQRQMLHQLQRICDFTKTAALDELSMHLGVDTEAVPPFGTISWADNAELLLLRSQNWVSEKYKQSALPLPARPKSRPPRLKVGYFSADFHNFPGMYLMAGLLEQHERTQFEIYAFSYGPQKSDEMRQRIVNAVDYFIDIREMPFDDAVKCATNIGIDIAIHRNGHTKNSRTELFSRRLAPIQINYLGYPGSTGADFMDYIIADPVVIPEAQRQFYSEKVIYLPHSYQPNDDTRQIAQTNTTRAEFGLPDDAFVFCCFNNSYKISPCEFDIWTRLLCKVQGSVLWLMKTNKWAETNLRKEAAQRGIDPSRLVFADKLTQAEHLARHKHADLFIDTFNYNAHTTASDALWAGLPLVTKQGKQFAARVAASLLNAVGLPELITETEEDYEALILDLATNHDKLHLIREKLLINRVTQPLFDTKRYTRDFEASLTEAYDLYFTDQEPQDISISGKRSFDPTYLA